MWATLPALPLRLWTCETGRVLPGCVRSVRHDVQTLLFKTSFQSRVGPISAYSNPSLNCYLLHLAFIILLLGIENEKLKVSMLVINVMNLTG